MRTAAIQYAGEFTRNMAVDDFDFLEVTRMGKNLNCFEL